MHPVAIRPSEIQTDFLPYELDYIPEELRKKAKTELFEDEETRTHSLRLLRSMLRDEPDLRWQDDDLFLLSYLRARKFDVKRAFHLMKTFYVVRRKRSELFDGFTYEDVKRTLKENAVGFLPYRDSEGCVILVIRIEHWNFRATTMGDQMRALTFGLLHAILSPATQIAGFKVIFDLAGLTISHLPHVSPTYLWLFTEALQNCFPGRFKAVHMINGNAAFVSIWAILKQFLKKKMKDRTHFHGKNVKKLHKYFSSSILPAEYEGELPPIDYTEWRNMMEEKADYFYHVCSFGFKKPSNAKEKSSSDSPS